MNDSVIAQPPPLSFGRANALYQPKGADLTAIAALSGTGFAERTGAGAWNVRALLAADIPDLSLTYAASSHAHAAADITSGVLDNARVNWAAPSAIGGTTPAAITGTTIAGTSVSDVGVRGVSATNYGVEGVSTDNYGVRGVSTNNAGVRGVSTNSLGVFGISTNNTGLYGSSTNGFGIEGLSTESVGVRGVSTNSAAVWGQGINANAGYFSRNTASPQAQAVLYVLQDHASDPNPAARIRNDGTGNIFEATFGSNTDIRFAVAASGAATHTVSAAATSTPVTALTLGHNTSGTPAAGFGAGLLWQLESSTTENRSAALDEAIWNTETDAGAIADRIVSAYYNAGGAPTKREGLRIRGGASATAIGFFGATPVAKPALGAWAGLTADQKLDALRDALSNLGLASYS